MNRKSFLGKMSAAMLLAIPLTSLWNCSDTDDITDLVNTGGADKNCLDNGTSSSVGGSQHGHSLTVPKADVEAEVEKTYSIKGSASHDHQVTVTASQFGTLKSNQSISVTSTSSGHSHDVTISCA